jgi:hypothetical protein
MNSMAIGRYRNANVTNPRRGYREPSTITTPIPNHRDGHYVRPNKVLSILISKKMLIQMHMLEYSILQLKKCKDF